jgi:hypothetical protein
LLPAKARLASQTTATGCAFTRRFSRSDECLLIIEDAGRRDSLPRHAWSNQAEGSIGISYVAVDEGAPRPLLGHFTLAMASVLAFPKKYGAGCRRTICRR